VEAFREKLLKGNNGCSKICSCGISTCINDNHQPWLCLCGHGRAEHIPVTYWTVHASYGHPHKCQVCSCEGLDFSLALLTTDEAIEELRRIQSDTQ
jgi:hypothetical protein